MRTLHAPHHASRIFDPNVGDGNTILVASFSDKQSWERERIDLERERELRELRSTMHNRHGVCG